MGNHWLTALSIIIGPIGVIVGVILNEKFRQKERKLIFSERYLEKKVNINERLYKLVHEARERWTEIVEKNPSDKKTTNELYSKTVFKVTAFIDENALYINETISLHIMFALLSLMDYPEMSKGAKKRYVAETRLSWKQILDAIREDLGFNRIDKELKSLSPIKGELKSMEEYIDKLDSNRK